MGRRALKYVEKTAIEASGIGQAQRAYKEEMFKPNGVRYGPLSYGIVSGVSFVAMPLTVKLRDGGKSFGLGLGMIADCAGGFLVLSFLWQGNIQDAFFAKLGYNTLAQIAPDVAKLAKDRVFQRAK